MNLQLSQHLKTFLNEIGGDINEQNLKHIVKSVNQCFSNAQCPMLQNHIMSKTAILSARQTNGLQQNSTKNMLM